MAARNSRIKRGIRFKFAALIGVLVAVLMAVDVAWNMQLQQQQSQTEALEKAEVLAAEMRAVWDFIDLNQDVINRNADGTFRSKMLVCVVSAKSVSTLFTTNTDYTIRFTSQTPRQRANAPDEFERRAFEAFAENPQLDAYYGVETDASGQRVFRYVEPLYVTETCLECHGDPAGEPDQYGYAKEGMQVGDVGGAMSIIEPMDIYTQGMRSSIFQQVIMVSIILVIAFAGIYFAVSRLVLKPLDELGAAAKRIGEGNFSHRPSVMPLGGPDEITEFVADFNKMSQRLERLCTDLESEVQEQTDKLSALNDLLIYQKAELKKALDRLSEETEYKNEFFAIMSHELRTPLTSILAFARILHESEGLSEKTRKAVDEIEANATLLLTIVNNILTISKVEARKDNLVAEPVDFVDLTGFVKSSLEPVAKNKGVELTAHTGRDVPISLADWEKLRRIMENLVDNAIKYTRPGGTVHVQVRFEDDNIVIEVADNGIGIDPQDHELIFQLYHQTGQSAKRRYRGTGLGLAVVKELAELHGGSVSVVSERHVGSTFTVRIPYVPVSMEEYDEDNAR